jgi:hypothetical protein
MNAGFNAHLLKPVDLSRLRPLLDSLAALPPFEASSLDSLYQEQLIARSLQRLNELNALRDQSVDQLAASVSLRHTSSLEEPRVGRFDAT